MSIVEKKLDQGPYSDQDYFKGYGLYVSELLADLDIAAVGKVTKVFLEAREKDKTIYFAGNGGSASTASHFAQDMAEIGRKVNTKGFRAQSITDNISAITALSNDYDYDSIFSLQMQYVINPGDVLVVISASGNSANVIKAVNLVKEKGGISIGLVGFDGGQLVEICDHVIHVKTPKGEYGPVEDLHLILDHMITSYITMELRELSLEQ